MRKSNRQNNMNYYGFDDGTKRLKEVAPFLLMKSFGYLLVLLALNSASGIFLDSKKPFATQNIHRGVARNNRQAFVMQKSSHSQTITSCHIDDLLAMVKHVFSLVGGAMMKIQLHGWRMVAYVVAA